MASVTRRTIFQVKINKGLVESWTIRSLGLQLVSNATTGSHTKARLSCLSAPDVCARSSQDAHFHSEAPMLPGSQTRSALALGLKNENKHTKCRGQRLAGIPEEDWSSYESACG